MGIDANYQALPDNCVVAAAYSAIVQAMTCSLFLPHRLLARVDTQHRAHVAPQGANPTGHALPEQEAAATLSRPSARLTNRKGPRFTDRFFSVTWRRHTGA
jgi:hypothetical protein